MSPDLIRVGMVVRHHSNRVYTIMGVANMAYPSSEKFPPTVIYMGANGNIWARKLDDFAPKFEVLFDGHNLAELEE